VSLNKLTYKLPANLASAVNAALADWKSNNKVARLWAKDAAVWTGADEANWLGWLSIVDEQLANAHAFKELAAEVKKRKFKQAQVQACDSTRHGRLQPLPGSHAHDVR